MRATLATSAPMAWPTGARLKPRPPDPLKDHDHGQLVEIADLAGSIDHLDDVRYHAAGLEARAFVQADGGAARGADAQDDLLQADGLAGFGKAGAHEQVAQAF